MHSSLALLIFSIVAIAGLPTNATTGPLVSIEINVPAIKALGDSSNDLAVPSQDPDFELMSGHTRIVGGSVTNIGTYPFMAAVLRSTTGSNFRLWCGGSIINFRTIITAAHCVRNEAASRFRFRIGSTNAHSGGRQIHVSRYRSHPNYRHGQGFNADLALLRAASSITFSNSIRAVRWAGLSHSLIAGLRVWAAGWGATRTGGATVEALRHVQMQIMGQDACRRNYAQHRLVVNANMVCAGWPTGGRDQCQGDSGGPLLHNGVLVGISSFGRQCGLANFPGVNTRISSFSSWISNNLYRS